MTEAIPTSRVILVALSFDETGESALYEAARVAEDTPGTELHIVHVVPDNGLSRELLAVDERLTGAPEEIRRRVELLWATHRCDVTAHMRVGKAAKQILQAAADLDADLIVVGTHRRAGIEKLVLGSVAQTVLQDAPCPVLVAVRRGERGVPVQSIEAPCPACVTVRSSNGEGEYRYWCQQHARPYVQRHVYEPANSRKVSLMSTF